MMRRINRWRDIFSILCQARCNLVLDTTKAGAMRENNFRHRTKTYAAVEIQKALETTLLNLGLLFHSFMLNQLWCQGTAAVPMSTNPPADWLRSQPCLTLLGDEGGRQRLRFELIFSFWYCMV
eukprot:TRINITY_DN48433_c0_g1_i1.p1 TRINITY_DN48433_c0_g1~~TRINITY_DN48433_c0_g1_i1.p1  ORF type:complete len:123 (-),score=4.29 TRINITY_DN48433_c0_g1_i1:3-371(-)